MILSGMYLNVTFTDYAIFVKYWFLVQGGVFAVASLRTALTSIAFVMKEIRDFFQILHVCSEEENILKRLGKLGSCGPR